ncbi:uncharacterized protein [Nicotiana tomentosiformis]|uniref:uncharacterized protein n=1 Tax=Nicotiana tomentosiformis TaxID=4098 RepID=UPI00388CAF09
MKAFIVKTSERFEIQGAEIQNLETQVGHIATILSERVLGTLSADTERNPKETVNAVTLRSGQVLNDPTPIQKDVKLEKTKWGAAEKEKLDKQFERFLDVLKQVHEILTKKKKIEETSVVELTEHCSAILQNTLPQKCEDPGCFTIPFTLGTINFDKSLCDSGASINLMPLYIYKKLEKEIGEIKLAPISLQLADQTVRPRKIFS